MKLDEEFQIIKCPCCGWQYMPAELYVPDAFIGTPSKISRDYLGHILYFDGETMCTDETYTCDNCGTTFNVSADVSFKTSCMKQEDYDNEYATKVTGRKWKLFEVDDANND